MVEGSPTWLRVTVAGLSLAVAGLSLAVAGLVSAGPASPVARTRNGPGAGSADFHPTIVERTQRAFIGQDGSGRPLTFRVDLPHPSTKGDLLVAAVDDGVRTSGMTHPAYLFTGWRLGVSTIGGETAGDGRGGPLTGGLKSAVYFYPDNPGGIRTVAVARDPAYTVTALTVSIAELSGVPRRLSADLSGTSTSGPSALDYSLVSTVKTGRSLPHVPALVVAVFNNGGNAPDGERYVIPKGWTVFGEDTTPNNIDQPLMADFSVRRRPAAVSETVRYLGGYAIDNCAAVVALG